MTFQLNDLLLIFIAHLTHYITFLLIPLRPISVTKLPINFHHISRKFATILTGEGKFSTVLH